MTTKASWAQNRSVRGRLASGWVAVVAAAAVVIAVVVGVQVLAGGDEPGNAPAGGSVTSGAGGGVVAPAPTAAGSIAAAADLFGGDADAADITRTSTVDLAASWPLRSCADAVPPEDGRVDFAAGTERGPEYGRDLAIGWYADADVARAAYDGLLATLAQCAAGSGARIATEPTSLDATAAVVTVVPASSGAESVDQSTYAVSIDGAVVVLASDHAATFAADDTAAPVAFEGTAGQAERLLTEACRVAPGRCG